MEDCQRNRTQKGAPTKSSKRDKYIKKQKQQVGEERQEDRLKKERKI